MEWTHSLDPTRPIAFVTAQKGGDDFAVSHTSCSHIILDTPKSYCLYIHACHHHRCPCTGPVK